MVHVYRVEITFIFGNHAMLTYVLQRFMGTNFLSDMSLFDNLHN